MLKTIFSERVRRRMFGLGLDSWNTLMLWALGFAAIAAFCVVATTYCVIELQKKETLDAELEIAKITKESSEAKQHAADANARAVELNLQLEQEKVRRQELAGRLLTKEQIAKFQEALRGKVKVVGVIVLDDPEANQFAAQIISAMQGADVLVYPRMGTPESVPDAFGLGIFAKSKADDLLPFTQARYSIGLNGWNWADINPPGPPWPSDVHVILYVGLKPPVPNENRLGISLKLFPPDTSRGQLRIRY